MDGLSVAAGTAGFVSLSIQVTQSLLNFYSAYKNQKSDVAYTVKKLEYLLSVLEILRDQLTKRKFRADEQDLLQRIKSSVRNCEECIQELQAETEKLKGKPTDSIRAAARTAAHRAMYPFRQSTLQKLDEDIDEVISNVSLTLQLLQQKDTGHVQDAIHNTKALLDLVRADQISSTLREWLKAPDVTDNYNKACEKWHPGTGLWFVQGSSFFNWLTNRHSFLWLYGFAGCGKSVLCSTAIQYAYQHLQSKAGIGLAFFFFAFNDDTKQDTSAMLRALVLQLSGHLNDNHGHLSRLHMGYRNAAFDDVYIFLDALDECPRDKHRRGILQAIANMRAWKEPSLHLLVTSREETDIRDELDASQHESVSLKNHHVDRDIAAFISIHLRDNRRLRKWEDHFEQIETALTERAKGVFRWVECQFTALESCPRCKRRLDRLLASLPGSLDQTYERMLLRIEQQSVDDARRILTLLCCARRPLTVPELIEGIAVELGDNPTLNPDGRLPDEDEIRRVCPGLIELHLDPYLDQTTARIAHFSVQEYLESERIHNTVATFRVRRPQAHAEIASICLTYLLEPILSLPEVSTRYPLALYAAKSWHEHYRNRDRNLRQVELQALRLLQRRASAYETWVGIWNVDDLSGQKRGKIPSPVYYASLLGLDSVLSDLLRDKPPYGILPGLNSSEILEDVNAQGGERGYALQAASEGGYEAVVRLLLEKGADVNAQGGSFGNALQAASHCGHESVIRLLLKENANVNARGGPYGSALQAASRYGHETVVRLLLNEGAYINIEGGRYGNALQAGSIGGNEAVVLLLLEKGADINAKGGPYGNALQAASYRGHEAVVRLLLDRGADIHAQGGEFGNSLQAASEGGHKGVVRLLLVEGADINAQSGELVNALQAAITNGDEAMVRLLLEENADVNAQGGEHGTALQAAIANGYQPMVRLLLDKGANVHAQGGEFGNALQAASANGYEEVLWLLLKNGADVNAQGGRYGNALQAASHRGHEVVVRLLLKENANVNARGGPYGSALQAASRCGHEAVVRLLINEGAYVNIEGGRYGNALQAASVGGNEAVVLLLLENGADVNARGGECGNALQAASHRGHEAVVRLLLYKGADDQAQGGENGGSLLAASSDYSEAFVQLLVEEDVDDIKEHPN